MGVTPGCERDEQRLMFVVREIKYQVEQKRLPRWILKGIRDCKLAFCDWLIWTNGFQSPAIARCFFWYRLQKDATANPELCPMEGQQRVGGQGGKCNSHFCPAQKIGNRGGFTSTAHSLCLQGAVLKYKYNFKNRPVYSSTLLCTTNTQAWELGYLSQCNGRLHTGRLGFEHRQRPSISSVASVCRLALRSTQPPIQWVWGYFPGCRARTPIQCLSQERVGAMPALLGTCMALRVRFAITFNTQAYTGAKQCVSHKITAFSFKMKLAKIYLTQQ